MASSPIDTESLYAAAPQTFVAERKRLAKALRDAGRRDEAKAIERLSRPTVSVWAVNQLARREPTRVKELGVLAARLRDAQASGGGAGAYMETAAGHRAALAALRARAEEILIEGGHKPSPQLLGRIVGNLRAGVANPELRPRSEEGRLERDLEESGFSGLFELSDDRTARDDRPGAPAPARSAAPKGAKATKGGADERARREQARAGDREREQARARDQERERALAEAERKARPLRAAAAAAGRTVERAARALEAARRALAEAERSLAAARADETRLSKDLAAAEAEIAAHRQRR
jgi:hypothetical protein